MHQSRGAILAAVLIAAAVALAIVFPISGERNGPIVVAESSDTTVLSETEKDAVRDTVREYLLENPDVIVEALEILQSRRQRAELDRARGRLASSRDALLNNPRDPSVGNPDASITVVEFFDYQCPYCKQMADDLAKLAEEDPDLRIVFKEFPVFGAESSLAARAALAADKQGKYLDFHVGVMNLRGAPSENAIFRLAEQIGLDLDRLRNDMRSPDIEAALDDNRRLARQIGVRGTPAFIVGDELIPGAMDPDAIRALIARKRQDS